MDYQHGDTNVDMYDLDQRRISKLMVILRIVSRHVSRRADSNYLNKLEILLLRPA